MNGLAKKVCLNFWLSQWFNGHFDDRCCVLLHGKEMEKKEWSCGECMKKEIKLEDLLKRLKNKKLEKYFLFVLIRNEETRTLSEKIYNQIYILL